MSVATLEPALSLQAAVPLHRLDASQYAFVSFMLNVMRELYGGEFTPLPYRDLMFVYYGWHRLTQRSPRMQTMRRIATQEHENLRKPGIAREAVKSLIEAGYLSVDDVKGTRYLRVQASALAN